MEAFLVPVHKLWHVHVDLVGPWDTSRGGHRHLLTVVDRTTRWAEAIPLRSTSAEAVQDAFVSNWVARFGMPAMVTTDTGAQLSPPASPAMGTSRLAVSSKRRSRSLFSRGAVWPAFGAT